MKTLIVTLAMAVLVIGCARVSVQGSKEPIKLDISMRLDVYQHVENEIDKIEGIVSGSADAPAPADQRGFLGLCVASAYAQEALGPDVEPAAIRRKNRRDQLYAFESKGVIGENGRGLVEARVASEAGSVKQLIDDENNDRMIIYKAIAAKNGISIDEVQKLYAKRMRELAPAGAPVEVTDAAGKSQWQQK